MDKELFLKTISFLRFPLFVFVVLFHSILPAEFSSAGTFPCYSIVESLVSIFTDCAILLFFLFSGYLFFFNVDRLTGPIWLRKVKSRVKTLLVPYLLWNVIVILRFFLTQTLAPGLADESVKLLADYTWMDWLRAFWDGYGGYPICFQFWFLRDLMVMILFTPVLYFIGKSKTVSYLFLLLLGVLWLLGNPSCSGFTTSGLFCFSAGAFIALRKWDVIEISRKTIGCTLTLCAIFIVATVVNLFLDSGQVNSVKEILYPICMLFLMLLLLNIVSTNISKGAWRVHPFLLQSSFFIFAAHPIFLSPLKKLLLMAVPHTDPGALLVFFLAPAATILIVMALFKLLDRFTPRLLSVLTGGRK